MKCKGYKYSEYNATYKDAVFNITDRGNGVLEIKDIESGVVFCVDLNDLPDNSDKPKGVWRAQEIKGQGTSIVFGSKGWYQELMYRNKKLKT